MFVVFIHCIGPWWERTYSNYLLVSFSYGFCSIYLLYARVEGKHIDTVDTYCMLYGGRGLIVNIHYEQIEGGIVIIYLL